MGMSFSTSLSSRATVDATAAQLIPHLVFLKSIVSYVALIALTVCIHTLTCEGMWLNAMFLCFFSA